MGRKAIAYMGALIGLYIVAAHGSSMGRVFKSGADGSSNVIKTLQGR